MQLIFEKLAHLLLMLLDKKESPNTATVNFGYKRIRYKGFSLIRDYAKGPKWIGSNFAAVGYKRLIKLVPADLLYPKLTVLGNDNNRSAKAIGNSMALKSASIFTAASAHHCLYALVMLL